MIRHLLGVKPTALGWSRFSLTPQPSSLVSINASVAITVAKTNTKVQVPVTLKQDPGALTATVTVPADTACRVCLPAPHGSGSFSQTAQLGHLAVAVMRLDGAVVPDSQLSAEGRMLCLKADLPPGQHEISRSA